MLPIKAVVVESQMITPFGVGTDVCWESVLGKQSAILKTSRFATSAFFSDVAATIPELTYHGEISLVMQMLHRLFGQAAGAIPPDAKLLLATTKGEIDLLEKCILTGDGDVSECSLNVLLERVVECAGTRGESMVLSAACTSSALAVARAAAMIRNGTADCVLVVACDSVTEFVYSGFSSLKALDKVPARPFDTNRAGLSIGEAAAFALIMSEERAVREQRDVLGEIAGWGMSDDANHMTGPSRESEGLIRAITSALSSAQVSAGQIDFISAHGTGTLYNDAMEMTAFHRVFAGRQVPVYSLKGALGHTMGAAGLVEMIVAQRAQRDKCVPPTVNLVEPDEDACGWVSDQPLDAVSRGIVLVTNAGFSGVNTALVLK